MQSREAIGASLPICLVNGCNGAMPIGEQGQNDIPQNASAIEALEPNKTVPLPIIGQLLPPILNRLNEFQFERPPSTHGLVGVNGSFLYKKLLLDSQEQSGLGTPSPIYPSNALLSPPSLIFETLEALEEYIRSFAVKQGYNFVRGYSSKWYGTDKLSRMLFRCHMHNSHIPASGNNKRLRRGVGSSCPFSIQAKQSRLGGTWAFEVSGEHNHSPTSLGNVLAVAERLNTKIKEAILLEYKNGRHTKEIHLMVSERFPKSRIAEVTVRNFIRKYARESLGSFTSVTRLVQYFCKKGYITSINKNSEGKITHIFFTSPKLMVLTQMYGRVLVLDCTYKTNRHQMPLLNIVSISPCNTNFQVGFAFISHETTDSYAWALKEISKLYGIEEGPSVLITDNEMTLSKAIASVFPSAKHMLCRWHIKRDLRRKLGTLGCDDDTMKEFQGEWEKCIESKSERDFNDNLSLLLENFPQYAQVHRYIKRIWVPQKEKFVAAWTNKFPYIGASSRSKVEGSHAVIKKNIVARYRELTFTFDQIDKFCERQIESLELNIRADRFSSYPLSSHELFASLGKRVSSFFWEKIKPEYQEGASIVAEESDQTNSAATGIKESGPLLSEECACEIRYIYEIPCRHIIASRIRAKERFTLADISDQWKFPTVETFLKPPFLVVEPLTTENLMHYVSGRIAEMPVAGNLNTDQITRELRRFCDDLDSLSPPTQVKRRRGRPMGGKKNLAKIAADNTGICGSDQMADSSVLSQEIEESNRFPPGKNPTNSQGWDRENKRNTSKQLESSEDVRDGKGNARSRHCSLCGELGHNRRTCKKNADFFQ